MGNMLQEKITINLEKPVTTTITTSIDIYKPSCVGDAIINIFKQNCQEDLLFKFKVSINGKDISNIGLETLWIDSFSNIKIEHYDYNIYDYRNAQDNMCHTWINFLKKQEEYKKYLDLARAELADINEERIRYSMK